MSISMFSALEIFTNPNDLEIVIGKEKKDGKDDKENFLSGILNPDREAIDQSKILNLDLIARIVEELRQHQVASTYKMFAVPT